VSIGRYASANLSGAVGDDPAAVATNRARLDRWAGRPVVIHRQVHGTTVAAAAGPVIEADAVVGGPGDAVAVLVADCLPVLVADPVAGVVAAVHAGRRGLAAGVLQAAVGALVARGADPAGMIAVVGPGICGRCYEVPAQLRAEVADLVPDTAATTRAGTPALDLPAGAVAVLRSEGVDSVRALRICTAEDARLFSHRGDGGARAATGRFAGAVVATGVVAAGVAERPEDR
jgi:YfiH family protein